MDSKQTKITKCCATVKCHCHLSMKLRMSDESTRGFFLKGDKYIKRKGDTEEEQCFEQIKRQQVQMGKIQNAINSQSKHDYAKDAPKRAREPASALAYWQT